MNPPRDFAASWPPTRSRWAAGWRWLVMAALALWVLGVLVVGFGGTRHYLIAPLTLTPRVWPAVVLLLLAVPGWWLGRRWMALLTGVAVFHALVMLEWRVPRPPLSAPPRGRVLRVITCNRGDQDEARWLSWLARERPDVVVMQDVGGRKDLASHQPEVGGLENLAYLGEHAVASRFAIRRVSPIAPPARPTGDGRIWYLPCLRVELEVDGRPIAIYSLHLRSPRDHLKLYLAGGPWTSPMRSQVLGSYWIEQQRLVAMLTEEIRRETIPVIVAGDCNLPDAGPLYRELTRTLQDAHREAGQGYGYTFPGDIASPLAGGGPWMRIDYVLPDHSWLVRRCAVQPDAGKSQHHGVVADLELR